ncbi:glycosyltransferase [Mariniphaga sediminis]|uniref:Glycosyltransferase n=2 Tax=Mariniphaga sediminis TaxID=1628158 RepID=A0A399D5J6_9BACT|nr:glycosyltransferase family 4 protein [Mariniphaga sediminis]RIH65710.1 glycosyltransferase [Mariniphaga sediminis]
MKNILLLTSVYPVEDFSKDSTPVVHYFAKEWVLQGYNVQVIHNHKYYPRIVYFLINLFKNIISKYYKFIFNTKGQIEERHYTLDNVKVHRLPILKRFPKSLYTQKRQKRQLEKIIRLVESQHFSPDVIIGHWPNPQLFLVSELAKIYRVPACMVMHTDVETIDKMYGKKAKEMIDTIDIWGFRSVEIKNRFESEYGKVNKSFLCYSGIPERNTKPPQRTFENGIKKFLFVGFLIPRKHPETLVKAVNNAFPGENFHITFVGEGREKRNIESLAGRLGIKEKVSLPGRLSREEVFEMMKDSDCFIMVSKPETFGLVYLEAMSMGCITIGSKGEGIDGVIRHGENGFLSKAGDHGELAELLRKISGLSANELLTLSNNAIHTASELTDGKVAKNYIESVKAVKSFQEYEEPAEV